MTRPISVGLAGLLVMQVPMECGAASPRPAEQGRRVARVAVPAQDAGPTTMVRRPSPKACESELTELTLALKRW